MRALATTRFGGNDVLELTEVPDPIVGPDTVLVRTRAVGLGWAEAGALPLAGLTAYQCVIAAGIGPGDSVLVHAASGGVGSFAVQFASWAGARVIGTAGPTNHDYLKGLGAEPVAYGDGLVTAVRELVPDGVSAIIDLVGGDALEATLDLGGDGLRLVSVINPDRVKALGGRYIFVRPNAEQLTELGRFAAEGSLRVHVRETFPFERAADALARVEEGHGPGKVVVMFD